VVQANIASTHTHTPHTDTLTPTPSHAHTCTRTPPQPHIPPRTHPIQHRWVLFRPLNRDLPPARPRPQQAGKEVRGQAHAARVHDGCLVGVVALTQLRERVQRRHLRGRAR